MVILITGGAGYVGSHTAVQLTQDGHEVVLIDNFSNSTRSSVDRIRALAGFDIPFHQADLTDDASLEAVFALYNIDVVIHSAALSAIRESVRKPLEYYSNELISALNLLRCMRRHQVTNFVFSSSSSVYGVRSDATPISEDDHLAPITPYGFAKLAVERILADCVAGDQALAVIVLRYFNVAGAHSSGCLGERTTGTQGHLVPALCKVGLGFQDRSTIFGGDWNTSDGTAIRDYIHVQDVADAHVRCVAKLDEAPPRGSMHILNIGSGKGSSVLDVLAAFEHVIKRRIQTIWENRKEGDVECLVANVEQARRILNWSPKRTVDDICGDAWNWAKHHAETGRAE